jgi:transglutaminase-like putative cysteine protease
MRLRAGCELVFEVETETPIVTMLRAQRCPSQRVWRESLRTSPQLPLKEYRDVFGNGCQRLTVPRGELRLAVETVAEVAADVEAEHDAARVPVARLPDATLQFTLPSRYCPSDKLADLARKITTGETSGYGEVRAICDYVYGALDYRYGVSNASTGAEQTLEAGAGVCRDFVHVAVALCRSIDIPARVAVGYLHGLRPMDLHAWFEAYVGDRWYTFDPTEDELLGGRILLAHGRDAADVAFVTDYGELKLKTMKVSVDQLADAACSGPYLLAGAAE